MFAIDAVIGQNHRLILMKDGSVYGYGQGEEACLATGSFGKQHSLVGPQQNAKEAAYKCWLITKPVRKVFAQGRQSMAIDYDGDLLIWGKGLVLPRCYSLRGIPRIINNVCFDGSGACLITTQPSNT